jgi:MFS family permease
VLYVVLFAGGAGFAPVIGCLLRVVGDAVPSPSATEAFGWITSGNRAGAAAGAALGGLLVQAAGTRTVFVLAGTATALAGLAAVAGRTTLREQRAAVPREDRLSWRADTPAESYSRPSVAPPSICNATPLMKAAGSEHRKATVFPN